MSTTEDSYVGELTYFLMRVPRGRTLNNFTFKFMLYHDGDGTWEPYTGGKPAPNPDYPMEIENVEIDNIYSFSGNMVDLDRLKSDANISVNRVNDRTVKLTVKKAVTYVGVKYSVRANELEFLKGKVIKIICDSLTGSKDSRTFQIAVTSLRGTTYIKSSQWNNYLNIPQDTTNINLQFIVVNTGDIDNVAVGDWATFEAPRIVLYDSDDQTWKPYEFNATETSLILAEGDTYENGKVTRARKQVTFDGSSDETWGLMSATSENQIIVFICNNPKFEIENYSTDYFCNRSKANSTNASWDTEGTYVYDNALRIALDREKASSVEELRTWLSTHPLTIEYELATPTTEELKIPTVPSYFPYTDVSTDNELETDMTWKVLSDCDNSLAQEALEKRIEALEMNALGE